MKVGLRREDSLCQSKWSVGGKQDGCWIEVNLATLTCWGYYQILNIGLYLGSASHGQISHIDHNNMPPKQIVTNAICIIFHL